MTRVLREILLTLVITGLGGLIVPTDRRTAVGRLGVHLRRAALAVIIVTLVFAAWVAIDQPEALFGPSPR